MGGGTWALPMLSGLVSKETINQQFVDEIFEQLGEEGRVIDPDNATMQPQVVSEMLRLALNKLVSENSVAEEANAPGYKPGP